MSMVTLLLLTSCGTSSTGGSEDSSGQVDKAARIIVTGDDLPTSWKELPQAGGEDDGSGSCLDSVTEVADQFGPGSPTDSRTASFTQSDLGPFLLAIVATPVDDVATLFDELVERVAACDRTTDTGGFTTTIEPLTFPTLGDKTFAVKATAANPNGSAVSYLLAMAPVDETLVIAAHLVSLGELDAALVEGMVRTMVGRA